MFILKSFVCVYVIYTRLSIMTVLSILGMSYLCFVLFRPFMNASSAGLWEELMTLLK